MAMDDRIGNKADISGTGTGVYLNGGGMTTQDGSIGLLAGSTLGGGTVVNYTFSFRTPDHVRAEWARQARRP